mgnify:CR=1 FL=1
MKETDPSCEAAPEPDIWPDTELLEDWDEFELLLFDELPPVDAAVP